MDFTDLDEVASGQYGLLTVDQALSLLGPRGLERAKLEGRLIRIHRGVYRCAGVALTVRQRALGACLACGNPVAVSHASAATLWTLEAVAPTPRVQVSVPRGRSGRVRDVEVHRASLAAGEVVERFGIPVTSPARTLLDLAPAVSEPVLARCVDDMLRRQRLNAAPLLDQIQAAPVRRRGQSTLRALLVERTDQGVSDSVGVDRVMEWIRAAGLPRPVCGYTVMVAGRPRFLDLAYPALKIAIEYNGWEYHQMRSRMDGDHARNSDLQLAGWIVLAVTAAHGEGDTVARIRRALARRREEGQLTGR